MKINIEGRPIGWTTLEEGQELVRLGLDPGTADMWWAPDADTVIPTPYITKTDDESLIPAYKGAVPCWSLGALMELMPKICEDENDGGCYPALCKGFNTDIWHCVYRRTLYVTDWYKSPTEAVYDMVCWLLKEGYLNPKP